MRIQLEDAQALSDLRSMTREGSVAQAFPNLNRFVDEACKTSAARPDSVSLPMFGVLARNPRFRRLWWSQVVSQAGDWLNRMACLALIGQLGGPRGALGILFGLELALRLLPAAVLGPFVGPIGDRVPRRLLMVASDLSRAAVVLSFLLVREPSQLPLLYALIALQMALGIFFDVARNAALPDTVSSEDLHEAHSLSAATWSVMLAVGALAGGFAVSWIGTQGVFELDAASYVVSALFLTGLRLSPLAAHARPLRARSWLLLEDLRDAWVHARERQVGVVLWAKAFWGAAGGFLVVLSLAGPDRYHESTAGGSLGAIAFATGVLYSARGLGTGFGPTLARQWLGTGDRALKLQIAAGFVIAALGYTLFGFAENLVWAATCVAFAHLGGSALWVASTVAWQRHVEDPFRARVFALEYFAMNLAFGLGGMLAGIVYDKTHSLAWTAWVVSAAVAVLGAVWSALALRRSAPSPEGLGMAGANGSGRFGRTPQIELDRP